MSFKKLSIVALVIAAMISGGAHALELEGAVGRTTQSETTLRIAVNQDWDAQWFNSSVGYLSGYWSLAYTHWEKGRYDKNVSSLSFSPVLTYNFYTDSGIVPFIEAGIGIAAFSKTKVGDRNLGSSFNFEDRFGFGVQFGVHTVGARVIHYSNAGIKRPNEGIESYSVYYSYKF